MNVDLSENLIFDNLHKLALSISSVILILSLFLESSTFESREVVSFAKFGLIYGGIFLAIYQSKRRVYSYLEKYFEIKNNGLEPLDGVLNEAHGMQQITTIIDVSLKIFSLIFFLIWVAGL